MSIGTGGIHIEKICHAEFADANFDAAARQLAKKREKAALALDLILAQREHFVNHRPPKIGRFA